MVDLRCEAASSLRPTGDNKERVAVQYASIEEELVEVRIVWRTQRR